MNKKKFIIEVGFTKNSTEEICKKENYPGPGFYMNEGMDGVKVLVYNFEDKNLLPCFLYDNTNLPEMEKHFIPFQELAPPPPIPELIPQLQEFTELPAIATGVSEQTLLKAIAIVLKPELSLNLLVDEATTK